MKFNTFFGTWICPSRLIQYTQTLDVPLCILAHLSHSDKVSFLGDGSSSVRQLTIALNDI